MPWNSPAVVRCTAPQPRRGERPEFSITQRFHLSSRTAAQHWYHQSDDLLGRLRRQLVHEEGLRWELLLGRLRRSRGGAQGDQHLLSTLGLVIRRLAEARKPDKGRGSEVHVPYQSSKLTRVLQDCLGDDAQSAIVTDWSISTLQVAETISTFGLVRFLSAGHHEFRPLLFVTGAARAKFQPDAVDELFLAGRSES